MLTPARIAIATAIVMLLSGCRERPPSRSHGDARAPPPPAAFPREMRFELLAAGDEPRTRLRYAVGDGRGARELVARAAVTTRQYASGAWSEPLALAPVRDGFRIAPGARGVIDVQGLVAQIDEAGASSAAIAASASYLARWRVLLEGRRAAITVDERGRFVGAALLGDAGSGSERDRDAREELEQRWLALAVPLPAEPVGRGARWRVVTVLRAGGIVLKQDATYTLTALDRAGWTVAVAIERLGEPQDIFVPGGSDHNARVIGELLGLRRVVTGTVTLATNDPLPRGGSLRAEVSSHARMPTPAGLAEHVSEDQASIELSLPVP